MRTRNGLLSSVKSTLASGATNQRSVSGNASANLYSLIGTAKANGVELYAYLRTVFTELPQVASVDEVEAQLPVPHDDADLARLS